MTITITRTSSANDIDFPIYIAIPHQRRAEQWFLTPETQPEEDDRYILGDHDLNNILCIESFEELKDIAANYAGHQWPVVCTIAEEILGYDVEFSDNEGHIAYGSYEAESVYSVDHAPTQADFDVIANALDEGTEVRRE